MPKKTIIASIIEIANELDQRNLPIVADELTKIAKNLVAQEGFFDIPEGIDEEDDGYGPRREPEIIICDNCGDNVVLDDSMTNRCGKCGQFYNGSGQRLSHPSQWGEETGEAFDSAGNQTRFIDDY
jgi:hypothetical protein